MLNVSKKHFRKYDEVTDAFFHEPDVFWDYVCMPEVRGFGRLSAVHTTKVLSGHLKITIHFYITMIAMTYFRKEFESPKSCRLQFHFMIFVWINS